MPRPLPPAAPPPGRRLWARVALGLALGTCGCGELDPYRGPGSVAPTGVEALVLSPALLDFGTRIAGSGPRTLHYTLQNAGDSPLTVHGHDEVVGVYDPDAPALFAVDAPTVTELEPGEIHQFAVSFTPPGLGAWEARIDVNDGAEVLELRGQGSAPVVGMTEPGRASAAFGCSDELVVEIFNQGDRPLTVSDVDVLSPDPAWSLQLDPSPFQLHPGGRTQVRVRFAPGWDETSGGLRNALIQVVSDDPQAPELSQLLEAVAYEGPQVSERFTYRPGHSVDLLVVADTAGVLAAHAQHLADASAGLATLLETNNVSLQLAGLTGASICPASSPAWSAADTPADDRAALLATALSGPTGPGSTMLVEHAIAALFERPDCLTGFLRPDAQLHLLVLAGGPDQSPRGAEAQLADLAAAVPSASGVAVSAVIPVTASPCAGTSYGAGYADMAIESGGAIADLCAASLADGMEAVAGASLRATSGGLRHVLAQEPEPDSISVRVDGRSWEAWSYDPRDRAVVFGDDSTPETGAEVEIDYVPLSDC